MPVAPDPETLMSQEERMQQVVNDPRLPGVYKTRIQEELSTPFPIDVREVNPLDFFDTEKRPEGKKLTWMRARIPLAGADANMHRCLAAFLSDWGLATASLLPHGIMFGSPKLKFHTSLDHSMWFHAPFRADEWMLFDVKTVKLHGGRGMNMGYLYSHTGELVITTAQECLIRLQKKSS
ncbi:Acot8 [Symbiodinium microadriaticum]|nr:Acot8 [Symbiodinium microadriaticum]